MKRTIWIVAILILACSMDAVAQNHSKKKNYFLPEVNDEVLISSSTKQTKLKTTKRKSTKRKVKPLFDEADALFGKRRKTHDKYANQEVSYRKRTISKPRRKNK